MRKRRTSPGQLTFRWQVENSTWKRLPRKQREHCRELLSQLLQAVAEKQIERSNHHERED